MMVTSNACSRLHFEEVDVVINFELPVKFGQTFDEKVYSYRIGRTGRFGRAGIAITLKTPNTCSTDISKVLKYYDVDICSLT